MYNDTPAVSYLQYLAVIRKCGDAGIQSPTAFSRSEFVLHILQNMIVNEPVGAIYNICGCGCRCPNDLDDLESRDDVKEINLDELPDGDSPLYIETETQRLFLVKTLLEWDRNRQTFDNIPPVNQSSSNQHYEMAMRQYTDSCDWEISHAGYWRRPCLYHTGGLELANALMHTVSTCKNMDLAEVLQRFGLDISCKDQNDRTCLFHAVEHQQYKACQMLMDIISVDEVDDYGATALQHYIEHVPEKFGVDIPSLLIELGKANINHRCEGEDGIITPLLEAIFGEKYDFAKYFVDRGALVDIDHTEKQTVWDLLRDVRDFDPVADLLDDTMHIENDQLIEGVGRYKWDEDFRNAWSLEEVEEVVQRLVVDESDQTTILALCREAKQPEAAMELLEYMEKKETMKKLDGLLNADLVREMAIPISILQIIASPLKWH